MLHAIPLRSFEHFIRYQAELYAPIENTNAQYDFDSVPETRKMKSGACCIPAASAGWFSLYPRMGSH